MIRHLHKALTGLFLFIFPALFSQEIKTIDLGGDWQFRQTGATNWSPAHVPGVVHLDLLNNSMIPDPFYRDNETKLQWIGETGWEYKKVFNIKNPDLSRKHIELVCSGLDTYAKLFLNDSLILEADNMFREWSVDIRRFLHPGVNNLRIAFPSVISENKARYAKLPYRLPGDEKVVCRKAACHFGWDWGPTFITSGIWRPINIRLWDDARICDVRFIQEKLTDSVARMTGEFNILSDISDSLQLRVFIDSVEILRQLYPVKDGNTLFRCHFQIPHPRWWWPNGLGNPNLYWIGYEIYSGQKMVDKGSQRIGLRTIELVTGPDSIGKSFYFKVNGLPVFMKGANYIPPDNFLPRVSDSTYRELIRDVKGANMNMLRVWGGGVYEKDVFYDLCDENGILIWQDFMFACAMYPGNEAFLENVKAEAIENVIRLRSHPCMALWCGNNEIDEGWKNWGWQGQYKYSAVDSATIYHAYKTIFESILPQVIQRFDPERPYISTSPLHGWGRSVSMKEGDSHYWGVWWGKEPFTMYKKKVGRFVSEYGFQGFPDFATIMKFTLPDDRQLLSPVMKAHQKHPVGYETIKEYMLRDYREPTDFRMYGYVSQLLQADGMRIAIQAHRKAKPVCMGTLFWQLNDCWPVTSWSSIDYYGHKKALYYEARRLFDPLLIIPLEENDQINVYITSDLKEAVAKNLHLQLMDFRGKVYKDISVPVVIGKNASGKFYAISKKDLLQGIDPGTLVFTASFGESDERANQSFLYFSAPKDLKLPVPDIVKKVSGTPEGYEIRLSSDKLVKNVYLFSTHPGDFSDNYFDMLPGKTYIVTFMTPGKNLNPGSLIEIKSLVNSY